ncbi:low temperature requirement protein A [Lactobacillus sp.]|uniref:low temperature requirement protein A n=1 Tax=Lactobacillus sp. TaxID=1591 RepID=UPI0019C0BF6E|nr:low temperature requirement protein A [Lactobacillus sp.]MBD5429664.1 low temperature requirement protein A [Lactobacillus sp.]
MAKILTKRVSLVELFYDLVFVYMISRATSLIHHLHNGIINPLTLGIFALVIIVFINSWMVQTVFTNRYGTSSWTDVIISFINMAIVLYMSNSFTATYDHNLKTFFLAAGLLSLTLMIQYLIVYFKTDNLVDKQISRAFALILIFRTICLLIGGLIENKVGLAIALIGIIVSWILPGFTGKYTENHPIIFSHLLERLTALIIVMFGETIVGIADYFTKQNFSIQSLLIFVIVVGLFFTYIVEFDHMIDENRAHETGNKLIYLHYFILFGLSMITVSLKFINEESANPLFSVSFLYGGIALFYIGLALSNYYNKKEMSNNLSLMVFFAITTLVGYLLALKFDTFTPIVIITTIVVMINVIFQTSFMFRNTKSN